MKQIFEDYLRLEKDIFDLLSKEIDAQYMYHNVNHTLDVIESVVHIAEYERLSPHEVMLLKTAALLHDIGFLEQYDDNEELSAQMAGSILLKYNYSSNDIEIIQHMIRMTLFPSNPPDLLSQILCDADLDYLGRDDYWNKSMLLFREWNLFKKPYSLKEWYECQRDFLTRHRYFSSYSKIFREPKKQQILKEISEMLKCC